MLGDDHACSYSGAVMFSGQEWVEYGPFFLRAPLVCFSATLLYQRQHNSEASFISSHGSRLTGLRQFR